MKKGQGKPLWLSSKVREKNEKKLKDPGFVPLPGQSLKIIR
jgi:hypothetical protein